MSKVLDNKSWVKLLCPSASDREVEAVRRVLFSGWWGLGPVTEGFEREFADFVGAKYAIALNSATAALHLAVKALGRRGKIVVPALTFPSTAFAALYEDCEVEFADIEEKTYCLDPEVVKSKIDRDTVAVIPVHYAGHLADLRYGDGISIIEDCAHAAGSSGAGKGGLVSCWSFHSVKNIAMGDGGMLTTNSKEIANKVRRLRWLGIDLSTYDREKKGYNWEYDIKELGYKYHTNDILAAIGLEQLRRIKSLNAKRKKIANYYNKNLNGLPIIFPPESKNWHLYVIRVGRRYRNRLIDFLRKNRISPGVHYKPLYYYSIFNKNIAKSRKELPVTERVWQEFVSLPIYPDLSLSDQKRVVGHIRSFFGKV